MFIAHDLMLGAVQTADAKVSSGKCLSLTEMTRTATGSSVELDHYQGVTLPN